MKQLTIREAHLDDIPDIMTIRLGVKENALSDPSKVTAADCETYLFQRGKGWVAIYENKVSGFAIVDMKENNVWALFVHPDAEKQGVGKQLHSTLLQWYFEQTNSPIWLSTDPGTRAEEFYQRQGWKAMGILPNGEMKFEMRLEDWDSSKS